METHKLNVKQIKQFPGKESVQKKGVYNSIIPFKEIVNSLKFTHRQSPTKGNDEDYFQRLTSDDRVFKIIKYLINQSKSNNFVTFPLNFILSINLIEDQEIESESNYINFLNDNGVDNELKVAFFDKKDNLIVIPENKIILIVDGQHRLAALKYLYYALEGKEDNLQENEINFIKKIKKTLLTESLDTQNLLFNIKEFEICATILLDFDVYEQAKVFADVNFNQKPVNKSLYYDIYGSFPNEDHNDIYIVHNWCQRLNEDNDSVLKDKIKMLGNGPGFVSQAFLCDELLPLVRKGGIWEKIMNDYVNEREDKTDELLLFIKKYFEGVRDKFINEPALWPNQKETASSTNSILLKTTGLAALIKLIPSFYKEYKDSSEIEINVKDRFNNIKENLETTDQNKTEKISGEYYFSKSKGAFSKGAGKGLQDKLFKELKKDLGFKDESSQQTLFSL